MRNRNPINEARELFLFAINDWSTSQKIKRVLQGDELMTWAKVALHAARDYSAEHGSGASKWREIFTDADVQVVATMLREHIEETRDANPLSRTTITARSQRSRITDRGTETKVPSTRLKKRRAKTAKQREPGIWANPLTRVKIKSAPQRGGELSARLVKRRKVTANAPEGFYANPRALKGMTFRFANVENDGGFAYGMDNVTPVTFVLSDRERKGHAWYRSFRLPDALIESPEFQHWASMHPRIIASLNELKRMLQPFMPAK